MIFALLTLAVFLYFKNPKSLKRVVTQLSLWGILAGLFLSANYFGYMRGLELTTASNAQIMIQLGPVALLVACVFIFKEEMRLIQWLGVAIASAGFILFNWDQVLIALSESDKYLSGNIWLIGAAMTWAIYAVLQKRLILRGWSPQEINLIIYFVATIVLMPSADFNDFVGRSSWQWMIFYLLALNTVIAYGAFAEALARIPSSQVSLIISVNPLLTIFIMQLMDHFGGRFVSPEPIGWRGLLGALLVVFGVTTAVTLRRKKPKAQVRMA
jgi:drug/metabolite transporter (DMT)-like permease